MLLWQLQLQLTPHPWGGCGGACTLALCAIGTSSYGLVAGVQMLCTRAMLWPSMHSSVRVKMPDKAHAAPWPSSICCMALQPGTCAAGKAAGATSAQRAVITAVLHALRIWLAMHARAQVEHRCYGRAGAPTSCDQPGFHSYGQQCARGAPPRLRRATGAAATPCAQRARMRR